MSQNGGENMKKISAIALVLLVCALLLGVGGGFLLAGENTVSINGITEIMPAGDVEGMMFCEAGDPGCDTPPGR